MLWSWGRFQPVAHIIHPPQVLLELQCEYHPVLATHSGLFCGSALQHLLPTLQLETDHSTCPFLPKLHHSENTYKILNEVFCYTHTFFKHTFCTRTIYWLSVPSSGFLIPLHLDNNPWLFADCSCNRSRGDYIILVFSSEALNASELLFSHSRC